MLNTNNNDKNTNAKYKIKTKSWTARGDPHKSGNEVRWSLWILLPNPDVINSTPVITRGHI